MRWLLLLLALPAFALNSPLTDEKWAFVRATPCPVTGYKKLSCPGYALVYPTCEPRAPSMRWVPLAEKTAYTARAKTYCACRAYPVRVTSCTTRGCRVLAVDCKL